MLATLVKNFAGKPSHPPLTDVSIGAYTVGVAMLIDGEVTTSGLILGVVAFSVLVLGDMLGGALAYVYGVRVVKQDVPIGDALIPGRLDETAAGGAAGGGAGRTDWTGWSRTRAAVTRRRLPVRPSGA